MPSMCCSETISTVKCATVVVNLIYTREQMCVTFPSPARGIEKTYSSWKSKLKAGCFIIFSSMLPRSIRTELGERKRWPWMLSTCIIIQQVSNCVCLPRLKRSIYCGDSQQMLGILIHSCLQSVRMPYSCISNNITFQYYFPLILTYTVQGHCPWFCTALHKKMLLKRFFFFKGYVT